jgi:hypothetical protein
MDRLNPAGIGITGDREESERSKVWRDGADAARGHAAHLLLYATGKIDRAGLTPADDPRHSAYLEAFGATIQAETIAGLTGKWGEEETYDIELCGRGNAIFPELPNQIGVFEPLGRERPLIVIDAGHRATQGEGTDETNRERSLTDDLALAYVNRFRAKGYDAFWFQRDLDGDNLPTETIGTRTTVFTGIGNWIKEKTDAGHDVVLLSCHYDGAHARLHAIIPDSVDLEPATPEDTAVNNPLDVRLGRRIMERFERAGLGERWKFADRKAGLMTEDGSSRILGLMSETESGVGEDGDRLGIFSRTVRGRIHAVRLVIEHGGTDDPAARESGFEERCAEQVVTAVDEIYGISDDGRRAVIGQPHAIGG